jgi:hypothetical protein
VRRTTRAVNLRAAIIPLVLALSATALAADRVPAPGPRPDPTLHVYRETFDGGVIQVLADGYVPMRGVVAIRARLRKEAAAFVRGDYPDPDGRTSATARLRSEAQRIAVSYSELRRGGQIRLRTKDPAAVAALHEWMAATVRSSQRLHPGGGPGIGE